MPVRRSLVFVAVVLALASGGCNRSVDSDDRRADGTTTTTTSPIPPDGAVEEAGPGSADQAFVTAADAACTATLDELEEVPAPTDERSTAEYLDRAYDLLDGLGEQLGELEPPAGGEQSYDELVGTLASEVLALGKARAAHDAGDIAERDRQFEAVARLERQFGAQARAIALPGCGRFAETR